MKKTIYMFISCFIVSALVFFSGCNFLDKFSTKRQTLNDEGYPVSSVVMNENEAKNLNDKMPIHLYFADESGTKLQLDVRYIIAAEAKKSVNNLASIIVKELIKGPEKNLKLKPTLPADTKLNSTVAINSETAIVDFSQNFIDKHPGGKSAEQVTIYSIVNSLTELKEIKKVKFTIDGKERKTFKENYRLDCIFTRDNSIIEKNIDITSSAELLE